MESSEAVPTRKSRNQDSCGITLCQMTKDLETWKLNERQQHLVDVSGLGNLIHTADLVINSTVLRAFCELWSKETNTARFHDFEMAPSLRDTAYILGIPVIGRALTTGAVLNMSSEQLFLQYLGQVPGCMHCTGTRVKLSWLYSTFSQLPEHLTEEEIVYSTRAYLLYLIGATLFPDKERGHVSPKYLPLLSNFEEVREYAWGAAALAHLYKALSMVMSSYRKRLFGSATLLMGWIYEYIPAMRPDTDDAPAHVFPRVCRWTRRTISQPANEFSDIRKAFSHLRVSDVNWEPYKDMDPASIPNICVAPDNVCSSRTWLINFNVREVYVPDRFARQFGREQHQLNDVHGLQRHQWNASVDWSLEYASQIKHFEQLTNAARRDDTTVPATSNTTEGVFTAATTAREFHDLSLLTVVENIKEELPTVTRFFEQQSLPIEVARSLARIRELLEASHWNEGNAAVGALGGGTSRPEPVPEVIQNVSDQPAPESCDTPRGEVGNVSGTPGEEEALVWSNNSEEDEDDARIRELLEDSHLREDSVAVDARGGGTSSRPELTAPHPPVIPASEQAATGTTDGPATAEAPKHVPDEAMPNGSDQPAPNEVMQNGSDQPVPDEAMQKDSDQPMPDEAMQNNSDQPVLECCDTPREDEVIFTRKICNQDSHGISVCQMTKLETWKLNERQQHLVDISGLGNLIHMADLVVNRTVLRAFCELWSKETNTARFHDFEMAPSLRDTAYILGIPVIGRALTTGAVLNMLSEQIFLQYLGQIPGCLHCRGSRVKLSWLHSKFSQLPEHPTDEEIVYSTRAYLLYLIGATLFPDKEKGYVSPKYLPFLSNFEEVREYAWGAAALAHLYSSLSMVMSFSRKRLFGSATLLMGWIYEYIPASRPDTDDAPAHVFPRVCRWTRRTISQPGKDLSDIRKAFSHLRVSDVNWEPYKDMDPASIPNICVVPDNICSSRTWLINFNVREVYVPDRFARQFGREQHQFNDVHGLQRHQWNASVDWSIEYASQIKHFEQLTNAAHRDDTTVSATSNTTEGVFTAATMAREFHDLSLLAVVENIKEELPTVTRFFEQQSLPVEVARSLARIRELLEASHLKEGNARGGGASRSELTAPHPPAIPACEQAATGTTDGAAMAQTSEHVPDEAMQSGSNQPSPVCCDTLVWCENMEEDEDDARIRELLEDSHLWEGCVAVDARGGGTSQPELTAPACEQAATGTTDGPATAGALEPVPDEAMPNGSDQPVPDEAMQNDSDQPVMECCDTPREEEVGGVSGTPGEEKALECSESSEEDEDERGQGRKRRGGALRRSNRRCMQAKRFKHRGRKGSVASDPIVL